MFSLGVVHGQQAKDFNWYNQETYKLYEAQNWNEMVKVGKEALDAGYDFFYLQLRIGIAYFEMEKYRTSQKYFNNALLYNKSDPLTLEYLYYAYLFSGRKADASLLFQKHKEILLKREITNPNAIIKSIYTEAGFKISSENEENIGNINFFHLGLEHQLGARLNIYHGYSRLTQKFTEYIDSMSMGQGPPRTRFKNIYKYSQNEYYIKGTIAITRGLQLIPAYHFQSIDEIDIKFNNHAYHIALKQSLGNFDLYAGYGNSTINNNDQTQWTGGLTFYPTGNLNLYLQSNYSYHEEEGEEANHIFYEKIGFKVAEKMWLEVHATFGNIRNFQEMDGFYVYNLPDRIKSRFGTSAVFPVDDHWIILGGFIIENKETSETFVGFQHYTGFIGIQYNL
jgi:hypothetical protein